MLFHNPCVTNYLLHHSVLSWLFTNAYKKSCRYSALPLNQTLNQTVFRQLRNNGACFFIDLGSNNQTEESIPVNAIGRKLKVQNNYFIAFYSMFGTGQITIILASWFLCSPMNQFRTFFDEFQKSIGTVSRKHTFYLILFVAF